MRYPLLSLPSTISLHFLLLLRLCVWREISGCAIHSIQLPPKNVYVVLYICASTIKCNDRGRLQDGIPEMGQSQRSPRFLDSTTVFTPSRIFPPHRTRLSPAHLRVTTNRVSCGGKNRMEGKKVEGIAFGLMRKAVRAAYDRGKGKQSVSWRR